jgi:Protein of unknown function (DUF1573)
MRRKLVSWTVAVVVWGIAFVAAYELALVAAQWVSSAFPPREPLAFPKQVDLGKVERGKELEASFTIKNQSSSPIWLSNFAGDCGCIGLFWQAPSGPAPLGAVLLNADEELAVSARFKAPGGDDSVFGHRVTFVADPPAPQPLSVLLTGTVQLDMYAAPSSVKWEHLRPNQGAEQVVRLVDLRQPSERRPFTLVSDHDSVTVEFVEEVERTEELSRLAVDCRVYQVKLRVQAGDKPEVSGSVLVRCGDEKKTIHSIPFYAVVVPAVRLVPSSVVLPRKGNADQFSAQVRLSSDSPCEFALGPAPKEFQLELDGNFLMVRCDPDALPDPGKHVLTVQAKAADGATHQLNLTVFIGTPRPGEP